MKDLSIYFSPVSNDYAISEESLGRAIQIHVESGFPELTEKGVAIVYVPEYRNSKEVHKERNDSFRESLYLLNKGDAWVDNIYDLGDILPGESIDDTFFALAQVVAELVKKEIIPIILGGSQNLTLACYKGFEKLERLINICSIDHSLDIGEPTEAATADGYVSHLLMQRPCFLFNFANIGLQRPLASKREIDLFDNLYFDTCRLGEFNMDFKIAEPHLRNSDVISIDFNSIKCADTDANCYTNPNGFYADQICQIAKYSGVSDKLSCLGIFNLHPKQNATASSLLAQIIWYFIDGVSGRYGDFPIGGLKNYTKFHVHMEDFADDLTFLKSDKSNRWWLEVKYPSGKEGKYERHQLVPCTQSDYEGAMNNQIPNLWWKTLQKLS
ncbi:MAG: formimidoylglutamase [Crocinitomicaceae bacterium]|jgi:formiminoglutamase|nr:formimidoylglutamase [Crocinitomicaceae bacterium]MDG1659409.1 formimidoylglutamase [Crocinitomicaceae bacterium]|tara:strand:- start:2467 stop:3618 length:1152 start_codon:yes stop_codon:yes gene_type:complete